MLFILLGLTSSQLPSTLDTQAQDRPGFRAARGRAFEAVKMQRRDPLSKTVFHVADLVYLGGGAYATPRDLQNTTITANWNKIAEEAAAEEDAKGVLLLRLTTAR